MLGKRSFLLATEQRCSRISMMEILRLEAPSKDQNIVTEKLALKEAASFLLILLHLHQKLLELKDLKDNCFGKLA